MAFSHPSENNVDGDDKREEDEEKEEEEEEEEEDEEEEPRLKYQRMGGSLPSLLLTDAAASIAIAERMIALGTHDGTVHILDFQGNQVKEFAAHTATVNDLSFEADGEYIGRLGGTKEFWMEKRRDGRRQLEMRKREGTHPKSVSMCKSVLFLKT